MKLWFTSLKTKDWLSGLHWWAKGEPKIQSVLHIPVKTMEGTASYRWKYDTTTFLLFVLVDFIEQTSHSIEEMNTISSWLWKDMQEKQK